MAWSVDNSTIFLSDAHSRNVTKCSYGMEYIPGVQKEMDATNCSTLVHLSDTGMAPEARPRGLAIDQDNHLWLAVEQNEGQGAILEINTDTGAVVSTIGNLAKSWNIHIKGTPHQPNKFFSSAQFYDNNQRCGKFHFGYRGLETPLTSKFVPKM